MILFHRVFVVAVVLWLVVSPAIWRHYLWNRFGVSMPWQFMAQLAALALIGLLALPALWRRARPTAWLTIAAVWVVVASHWAFSTLWPADGLISNGLLLCAAAALTFRIARQ